MTSPVPHDASTNHRSTEQERRPTSKVWLLLALLAVVLVFKGFYVRNRPINSDEPQHLHVVWGWTQGMVQYRDYFDNHTPLFHLAMAPVVKALGERPDLVARMRVTMLPLWALGCGTIGWLAARLYSRRAGVYAALLAAACPSLLMVGSEFRADILWMTLWLATVGVALSGPFTHRRALLTGLLLGATFGTSMKTSLLAVSLLSAFALTLLLLPSAQRREWLAGSWGKTALLAVGVCVIPMALAAFFAEKGALSALQYCVFQHNLGAPVTGSHRIGKTWDVFFILFAVAAAWICRRAVRQGKAGWQLNARRSVLVMVPFLFHIYLAWFWPLVTRQDFLPCLPLFAIPLAGLLGTLQAAVPLTALAAAAELIVAARIESPFQHEPRGNSALVNDVLCLVPQGSPVMDAKGETLFRPRPFYYCLENITCWKLRQGLIPDTISTQMSSTSTCVCVLSNRFPQASRAWVQRFFLPVTPRLLVAGCHIPKGEPGAPREFEVGISTRYQFTTEAGEPMTVAVDGVPAANGRVYLTAGKHTFTCDNGDSLNLIWARAFKKGYKPLSIGLL